MIAIDRRGGGRFAVWLLATLFVGAGCPNIQVNDTERFAVANVCNAERGECTADSKVSSESASEEIDASEECAGAGDRNTLDVSIDGQSVYVAGTPSLDDQDATRVTCVHAFTGAVDTTCTASSSSTVEFWETGGSGFETSFIGFEATLTSLGVAPGAPGEANPATGSVTVQCQGDPQIVPIGGPIVIEELTGFSATCDTTLTLTSEVDEPGTHLRVLTLQYQGLNPRCQFDGQCALSFPGSLPICGPFGTCQAGVAGDTCLNRLDCAAAAPYCVQDRCREGHPPDPCYDGQDCASGVCNAGTCGL